MAEPQFPVATDDFFNRDIKPLRNTYGLTSRESGFITAYENQELQPQLEEMMKLRSQLLRERNSELAYQSSLLEFEEKKRKAQEEIDFGERTEELTKSLNNIIDDPNKNNFQKQRDIAAFGMKNAKILSKHPAANIIFKSATDSLKSRQAESDAADKNLQTMARMATAGIDPVDFRNFANADGITTPAEAMEAKINEANFNRGKAAAERRTAEASATASKAQEARLDAELKLAQDEYSKLRTTIKDIQDNFTTAPLDGEKPDETSDRIAREQAEIVQNLTLSDGTTLKNRGVTDISSALVVLAELDAKALQERREPALMRERLEKAADPQGAANSMRRKQTIALPDGMTPDQLQQLQQLIESFKSQ